MNRFFGEPGGGPVYKHHDRAGIALCRLAKAFQGVAVRAVARDDDQIRLELGELRFGKA
jgi:hypothetical protein